MAKSNKIPASTNTKPVAVKTKTEDVPVQQSSFDITEVGREQPEAKNAARARALKSLRSLQHRATVLAKSLRGTDLAEDLKAACTAIGSAAEKAEQLEDLKFAPRSFEVGQSVVVRPNLHDRYVDVLSVDSAMSVVRVVPGNRAIVKDVTGVQQVVPTSHLKSA